tara:strand:+ start:178 stop:1110 length:933 start_codon:yes stop_codon:yes gene_type:complete
MKKILLALLITLFSSSIFASDEKPGRFFEDQPDVTDDYQIHFLYLITKDAKDREWDINGKMEEILLEMNEIMARETKKKSKGTAKKYKYDYRKDGKIDITFIRLDKTFKELHKYPNANIAPYLWLNKFNNPKKIYFSFSDMGGVDGGEAGVPMGSTFLRNKHVNSSKNKIIKITLHELHHAQGGGFICVPGMGKNAHYQGDRPTQLGHGLALSTAYMHNVEGCPQLVDSVYLTPTSEDPYDPYKITCERELGKYTHKKIMKMFNKQNKNVEKGHWFGRGFGSYCKWQWGDGFNLFTDSTAAEAYEQTGSH